MPQFFLVEIKESAWAITGSTPNPQSEAQSINEALEDDGFFHGHVERVVALTPEMSKELFGRRSVERVLDDRSEERTHPLNRRKLNEPLP